MSVPSVTIIDIQLSSYFPQKPNSDERDKNNSLDLEKLIAILELVKQRKRASCKMLCGLLTSCTLFISGSVTLISELDKEPIASAVNCIDIFLIIGGGMTLCASVYLSTRRYLMGKKVIEIYHELKFQNNNRLRCGVDWLPKHRPYHEDAFTTDYYNGDKYEYSEDETM